MKMLSAIFLSSFLTIVGFASTGTLEIPGNAGCSNSAAMSQTINITMYDSFGDGWNTASLTILDWNGYIVWNGTFLNGYYASYNTWLLPGCYTVSVTGGFFPWEISWTIDDGIYLLADGGAPSTGTAFSLGNLSYGCTDPNACNYLNSVNCNDGSCCYYQCVKFEMSDAQGNGWGAGNTISLMNNLGEIVFTTTLASGSYGVGVGCLPAMGCYRIIVAVDGVFSDWVGAEWTAYYASSYLSGWTAYAYTGDDFLFDCATGCTTPDASNFSPWNWEQDGNCCFENAGVMTLQTYNDDSWAGKEFRIHDWNGEVVMHGSMLLSGYQDYAYFDMCLPSGCYWLEVDEPLTDEYAYWSMWFPDVYLSGYLGEVHVFTIGEIVDGCTEPQYSNYDPAANCNDACAYTCPSDLDQNGAVNITDLLIFTSEFGSVCD